MAAALIAMPAELIGEIFSYFYRDETEIDFAQDWLSSQKQLLAVCQASKAFYNWMQPYLYRQIYVSLEHLTGTKYLSLLRTLASRPDLGGCVKHLKLEIHIPIARPDEINRADMATFLEITRPWLWNRVYPNWATDPQRTQEALVDLLLFHLPNLKVVHLSIASHPYGSNTQPLARPSHPFAMSMVQRLTSLHVYHSDLTDKSLNPGITYTPQISNFLKYFSTDLDKFVARRCGRLLSPDVSCFDNIQDLSLHDVGLDNTSMALLMNACHGLRRFAYTSWNHTTVTPKACLKALEQHSSTLVNIYLRLTYPERRIITSGGYESFHMFTELEKLNIFPADFNGANSKAINTLPQSLKHITLSYWSMSPYNVAEFAEAITQLRLPKLETLNVQVFKIKQVGSQILARHTANLAMRNLGTNTIPFRFSVNVLRRDLEDPRK